MNVLPMNLILAAKTFLNRSHDAIACVPVRRRVGSIAHCVLNGDVFGRVKALFEEVSAPTAA